MAHGINVATIQPAAAGEFLEKEDRGLSVRDWEIISLFNLCARVTFSRHMRNMIADASP